MSEYVRPIRLGLAVAPAVAWVVAALLQHTRNGVEGGLLCLAPAALFALCWGLRRRRSEPDAWQVGMSLSVAAVVCLGWWVYPIPAQLGFVVAFSLLCMVGLELVWRGRGRLLLSREVVFAGAFSVWCASFVLAPYWALPVLQSDTVRQGDPGSLLMLILALGLLWARGAAGPLRVDLRGVPVGSWLVVGASLIVLDAAALTQPILVNDDETMHFPANQAALYHLRHTVTCAPLLWGAWVLLVGLAARRWRSWPACLLLSAVCVAGVIDSVRLYDDDYLWVLRHPFLGRWLEALPLALGGSFIGDHRLPEWSYRLVPCLSGIAVSWLVVTELRSRPAWLRIGAGLVVGTLPLIVAYRSMLYLEMPALPLLTWACLRAETLTGDEPGRLRTRWGWGSLLLAGFIRETTIGILAGFLAVRWLRRLWLDRRARRGWARLRAEASLSATLLLPVFLYVWFRGRSTSMRNTYDPVFGQLFDLVGYLDLLSALVEQMLPLLLLGGAGAVLAWRRGARFALLTWSAAALAHVCFHRLDPLPVWWAYGRFNLYLVPPLLAAAVPLLTQLPSVRVAGVLICALALNLLGYPLYRDGSRVPGWGRGTYPLALDDSYPYDQALVWLRDHAPRARIRFSGPGQYAFWFYFPRLGWAPAVYDHEWHLFDGRPRGAVIDSAFRRAAADGVEVLVLQQDPADGDVPPAAAGFVLVTRIHNRAHSLLIYQRSSSG